MVVELKQIKFFQERQIPDKSYIDIAQSLTYLKLPKGAIVFEYGTLGDLFYIILNGTVSVHVPNKKKIEMMGKEKSGNLAPVQNNQLAPKNKNDESADQVGELPISRRASRIPGRRRSTLMRGFVSTLGNNAIRELLDEPIFDEV